MDNYNDKTFGGIMGGDENLFIKFALGMLSLGVATLVGIAKMSHKSLADRVKEIHTQADNMDKRIVMVECSLITEKEVRGIMKEYLDPLVESNKAIQQSIHEMEKTMAAIPKRKSDP